MMQIKALQNGRRPWASRSLPHNRQTPATAPASASVSTTGPGAPPAGPAIVSGAMSAARRARGAAAAIPAASHPAGSQATTHLRPTGDAGAGHRHARGGCFRHRTVRRHETPACPGKRRAPALRRRCGRLMVSWERFGPKCALAPADSRGSGGRVGPVRYHPPNPGHIDRGSRQHMGPLQPRKREGYHALGAKALPQPPGWERRPRRGYPPPCRRQRHR